MDIVITPDGSNCVTCEPIEMELDASSVTCEAFSGGKCAYSSGRQAGKEEVILDWEKYFSGS